MKPRRPGLPASVPAPETPRTRRRKRSAGSAGTLRPDVVRGLLGSHGFVTDTSASDLFLLALGISRRASLDFERAIDVLVAAGMLAPPPQGA